MKIDDYLFEPCGYSMNGILSNESNDYGLVSIYYIHGILLNSISAHAYY